MCLNKQTCVQYYFETRGISTHLFFFEKRGRVTRHYSISIDDWYKPTSGLSQILPSDWLSYSLSIGDRPLVAKGITLKTMAENLRFTKVSVRFLRLVDYLLIDNEGELSDC